MDPRAQHVVRRLGEMESGEVLAVRPDEGYLEVRRGVLVARLHLPATGRPALVDDVDSVRPVWGDDVSDVAGPARFVAVHLDESPATREAHRRRRRDADGPRPA